MTTLKVSGIKEALHAFSELPRRVGLRHLRIALSAGAGVVRDRYASIAPKKNRLLSKSIGIKVAIPDASFNKAHHGKPAYAVVGVKRRAGKFLRVNKQGKLKGYGAAQKALNAERKRLAAGKLLTPLQREIAATKTVAKQFGDGMYKTPSRYAHLAGPGREGAAVLAAAVVQTRAQAQQRIADKLAQGIETERRALAPAGA